MIINDFDGYYIVFDTKNGNIKLDTLLISPWNTSIVHAGILAPATGKQGSSNAEGKGDFTRAAATRQSMSG